MPKTEVLSLFLIKTWDTALSARQAGAQTFLRHVSSEADSEDCPGVSMGHANPLSLFFKNMVFIKRASISREAWFGRRREGWVGKEAEKQTESCLMSFQTTPLFMSLLKSASFYKTAFGE